MSEAAQARTEKLWSTEGFGERMHLARKRAGLTLDDVGKALGITGGAVSLWESNQNFPSRQRLEEFAKLTGVEASWLQFGVTASRFGPDKAQRVPIRNPWALGNETASQDSPFTIEVRSPCSPSAFAIEIFDGLAPAEYKVGDIIVIDPEAEPVFGDVVLVGEKGAPRLKYYWPKNSFSVLAAQFYKAVRTRLAEKDIKPHLLAYELERIIQEHEQLIPLKGAFSAYSEGQINRATSGTRGLGVAVEHTRQRRNLHNK